MENTTSKSLKIGNLIARVPVIQGGMGVGISLSSLAGAVAKAGGVGVISAAQIGFREPDYYARPLECNLRAVKEEILKARELSDGGVIGVNIMVATQNYDDYVKAAVEAKVDLVISGAGLPMDLPKLVEGSNTKIAPIVSGPKAASIIMRQWLKKYNRLPDLIVIEGPWAGGHLGFSREEIMTHTRDSYDAVVKDVIACVHDMEIKENVNIPVVVGGGVFGREDMEHYMSLGANGVQIGTRFVTTYECDASLEYKTAYINAKEDDVVIVKSPVGMPGRAIQNKFLDRVQSGERIMGKCVHCVKTCDPSTTPYCITRALVNAALGNVDEGLIFCGSNVGRVKDIVSVQEIMEEFA